MVNTNTINNNFGAIVATETEDSDNVFDFIDVPIHEEPIHEDDEEDEKSSPTDLSKPYQQQQSVPKRSILKKNTSYGSLCNLLTDASLSSSKGSLSISRQGSARSGMSLSRNGSARSGMSLSRNGSARSGMSLSRNGSARSITIQTNTNQAILCAEEPEEDSILPHASSSESSVGPSTMKRSVSNVSFQSVNVREYDRTLGDNPSCMSGPPISLDWSYSQTHTDVCIDEYESQKTTDSGKTKKKSGGRRISKYHRELMLKNSLGFSEEEIDAAKKERKDIRRSRSMTQLVAPFWRIEHACQSLKRKFARRRSKVDSSKVDNSNSTADLNLSRSYETAATY